MIRAEAANDPQEQRRFVSMVLKYLRPYRGVMIGLFLIYALFTVLTAIQPLLLAPILDIVLNFGSSNPISTAPTSLGGVDLNNIGQFLLSLFGLKDLPPEQIVLYLALGYLVVSIVIAGLSFLNYMLAIKIKIAAGRDIQVDLFGHLFTLSLDFFNNERIGEIVARLDQDTKNSVAGLELALRTLLVSPLLILYYGYLLVITNVSLTIFIVIAAALNYALTQLMRPPIRRRMAEQINVGAEVTAYLQERLASARLVKSFVGEDNERTNLRKMADEVQRVNMRYGFLKTLDEPVTQTINALINVGILLFSLNELFSGRLTPTGFLLYLFIGRSILGPLATMTQAYNSIQSTLASGVRVRELFAIQPSVVSGDKQVKPLERGIKLERVSFSYKDFPVLHEIDFEIVKGTTTALVGPSGGGKSTITDLLMRFYDVNAGRILFDGQDLRELKLGDYRKLFGVVAQESVLFNASIAENIAYARPWISQAEIEGAARIANAHDFITELPYGYETYVGDRGVRLSGGQRQRVAIARAIAHQPEILVLDEATSSLDSESEQKVQMAVDKAIQTTTAIVIAHRLSTVIRADQIVLIDQGRVVDKGKHTELMERSGLYRNLASMQFNSLAVSVART
jgi:ABC-type multidrug transport system fused ATPase/permease subunit